MLVPEAWRQAPRAREVRAASLVSVPILLVGTFLALHPALERSGGDPAPNRVGATGPGPL